MPFSSNETFIRGGHYITLFGRSPSRRLSHALSSLAHSRAHITARWAPGTTSHSEETLVTTITLRGPIQTYAPGAAQNGARDGDIHPYSAHQTKVKFPIHGVLKANMYILRRHFIGFGGLRLAVARNIWTVGAQQSHTSSKWDAGPRKACPRWRMCSEMPG